MRKIGSLPALQLRQQTPRGGRCIPAFAASSSGFSPSRRACLTSMLGAVFALPGRLRSEVVAPADTSRLAREQAAQRIPFRQLNPRARQKLSDIVERPTLFRRMPAERIPCDPEMFQFLIRYPEVIVNMWQLMGATKIQLRRVAEYVLDADDGSGTQTRIELVYGSRNTHIMYAEGEYSGPLFRSKLSGRCVLVLSSDFAAGGKSVTSNLEVFLSFDNLGADLVARTIHPMIGRTADHNFTESARFVSQVSQQAVENPSGMTRLADRLEAVDVEVRRRFAEVVAVVGQRPFEAAANDAPPPRPAAAMDAGPPAATYGAPQPAVPRDGRFRR